MIVKDIFQDITIEAGKDQDKVQFNSKIEPDKKILNFWKPSTSLEEGIKKLSKKF